MILTPYAFRYAFDLQTIILEDNALAVLIFGEEAGKTSIYNTAGEDMAYHFSYWHRDCWFDRLIYILKFGVADMDYRSSYWHRDC